MIIRSLEDFQIYSDALDAAEAISALLRQQGFRRDFHLRDQLAAASDKVAANISEGYGQKTDRHFAHYLGIARGSCNEIRAHLAIAKSRDFVSQEAFEKASESYVRLGKRLTRLMQHLQAEDRKQRG